jgi:hypothetical protein
MGSPEQGHRAASNDIVAPPKEPYGGLWLMPFVRLLCSTNTAPCPFLGKF